jgi:hypothetical protein
MLFSYLQDTERFLRDGGQRYVNPDDIISWVNRARREVAMRTQCIRRVPPISGPITALTVTQNVPASNLTNIVISGPDSPSGRRPFPAGAQATALPQIIGTTLVDAQLTYGGDGYFQPTVSLSDQPGSPITATVAGINVLNPFQEEVRFTDLPLGTFPGVASVYAIRGVSSLFNNLRYSWIYKSFSEYQAFIRTYTQQYFYTPAVFTQVEQGVNGSILIYPIPAQTYQWEPDCQCLPSDLIDDQSPEAIPAPWTETVPYMAASLAYQHLQNLNFARYSQDQDHGRVLRYSNAAHINRTPVIYSRRY